MSAATAVRTIQVILAPVVMVTACAILMGGLLARYDEVNGRMRAMAAERLQLLGNATSLYGRLSGERLAEIDHQLPQLLWRHELLRDSILLVHAAVLIFVGSMFVIAASALAGLRPVAAAAILLFLGGTAVMLAGLVISAREIRVSHRAVEYEVRRVAALVPPPKPVDGNPISI